MAAKKKASGKNTVTSVRATEKKMAESFANRKTAALRRQGAMDSAGRRGMGESATSNVTVKKGQQKSSAEKTARASADKVSYPWNKASYATWAASRKKALEVAKQSKRKK